MHSLTALRCSQAQVGCDAVRCHEPCCRCASGKPSLRSSSSVELLSPSYDLILRADCRHFPRFSSREMSRPSSIPAFTTTTIMTLPTGIIVSIFFLSVCVCVCSLFANNSPPLPRQWLDAGDDWAGVANEPILLHVQFRVKFARIKSRDTRANLPKPTTDLIVVAE